MNKYKLKGVEAYIMMLLILMASQPLGLIAYIFKARVLFLNVFNLGFLLIDLGFILINLKRIRFNKIEIILILILLSSIPIGFLNTHSFGRRHISDFLVPLLFVLKISITRHFLAQSNLKSFFVEKFIPRYIWWNLASGIFGVIGFYVILMFKSGGSYLGLAPEIYPFLIYSLITNNTLFLLIAVGIVFVSGKRSILLGTITIILISKLNNKKNIIKSFFFFIGIFVLGIIFFKASGIQNTKAFMKYQWTVEKLLEQDNLLNNPEIIDKVTGGRLGELNSVLGTMKLHDYFIGKGVGFTYHFKSSGYGGEIEEHSNVHFTPISIITKYGFPFYLVIMTYVIYSLYRSRKKANKKDFTSLFLFFYIVGININFLFAYGFFLNKLFPFAIGYLNRKSIKPN